jgi:hypothetical protein
MSKSENIKLKGRELATRSTGILTPMGGRTRLNSTAHWVSSSPSITLTVRIDVEFDLKRVMENMRTRLHTTRYGRETE